MNPHLDEIILGIDPGTTVCGFGLIKSIGQRFVPLDYGCIRPPVRYKLSDRYLAIFNSITLLIQKYKPTILVVETQYVHKNVQSAIKLGMARGVALLAGKMNGLQVFEYSPTQAKKAVVGSGRASKVQVQSMVQKYLNLVEPPTPEDASDALALALCYAHTASHLKPNHEI